VPKGGKGLLLDKGASGMSNCAKNSNRGSIVSGIIILGIGLYFLAVNQHIIPTPGRSWPFFLVIVGVALIIGHIVGGQHQDKNPPPPPTPGF
jgi:hypothetical protein